MENNIRYSLGDTVRMTRVGEKRDIHERDFSHVGFIAFFEVKNGSVWVHIHDDGRDWGCTEDAMSTYGMECWDKDHMLRHERMVLVEWLHPALTTWGEASSIKAAERRTDMGRFGLRPTKRGGWYKRP